MIYEATGRLKVIMDTKQLSDKFSKREFAITTEGDYPQTIVLQLINGKCIIIDQYNIGELIKVKFNISGKPWKNKEGKETYFNSLNVTIIELVSGIVPAQVEAQEYIPGDRNYDDLSTKVPSDFYQKESLSDDLPF